MAFEIDNISHLKNLFKRKKNKLKINTDNEELRFLLSNNENNKILSNIADKEKYCPIMTCKLVDFWRITPSYHLAFNDWTLVVEPTVKLFKNLID